MKENIKDMENKKELNLSDDQMKKLLNDYMSSSSVITLAQIIDKYNLCIKTNELVKYLPEQKVKDNCPFCNSPMVARIKNRTSLDDPYCPVCSHISYPVDNVSWIRKVCSCENCKKLKMQIEEEKRALIVSVYGKEHLKVDFSMLNLREQLNLLEIIFNTGGKVKRFILGHKYNDYSLLVKEFMKKELISISPTSSFNSFKDDEKFPSRYYPDKVTYNVNVNFSEDDINNINEGIYFENVDATVEEKLEVFYEIMHEDVLDRFADMMHERGLGFEVLVNAEDEFKKLYRVLSYGQITNLCFQVARYYLDKTKTGKIYKSTVPKAALKTVVTFYNNSSNNSWQIKNSEVSYAGKRLKFYIEKVLHKDIRILQKVVTEKDIE